MKKFKKTVATLALTGVMALSNIITMPANAAGYYSAKMYNNKLGGICYNVPLEYGIGSEYYLENTGADLYLPQVSFRYYFTNDGVDVSEDNIRVIIPVAYNMDDYVDYSKLVDVKIKELPESEKNSWKTHYIDVRFKQSNDSKKDYLKSGQRIKINLTVAAEEGAFNVYNDWSFDFGGESYKEKLNRYIPVYWDNQRIW